MAKRYPLVLNSTSVQELQAGDSLAAIQFAITEQTSLTFDLSQSNNFKCTLSAGGTLTFTNHVAGQSGFILLINAGGYAITKAATTKSDVLFIYDVSAAGTYLIQYYDDGTNAYVLTTEALS